MFSGREMETIAKIQKPRLANIHPRRELFDRLDGALEKPATWISAGSGYGKTTLAASYLEDRRRPGIWYQVDIGDADISSFFYYLGMLGKKAAPGKKKPFPLLTPEYQKTIQVFSRNFFRELYHRLKPASLIVFDNYEAANEHPVLNEVLSYAIEELPDGVRILVLSRLDPPLNLARLRSTKRLSLFTVKDMRLNFDDSCSIISMHNKKLDKHLMRTFHDHIQGWVSGLILILEKVNGVGDITGFDPMTDNTLVFDYFASEIFRHLDPERQWFMMKTAFLPKMTVSMAKQFTGIQNAAAILDYLVQRNCFTFFHDGKADVFSYHALFRDFLLSQIKPRIPSKEYKKLAKSAARLLESSGMVEDAADWYRQGKDWSSLTKLISQNAAALLNQGRNATLEKWILFLPKSRREKMPWIQYWLGICRLPFSPLDARSAFEKSYKSFRIQKDPTGSYLSWAGIIDTFIYNYSGLDLLDQWIEAFDDIQKELPDIPPGEIEARVVNAIISALLFRQPQYKKFQQWVKRGKEILYTSTTGSTKLILTGMLNPYCAWIGDLALFEFIIQTLDSLSSHAENHRLPLLRKYTAEAQFGWLTAQWETCDRALVQALKISEETGIHLQDFEVVAAGFYRFATATEDPVVLEPFLEKLTRLSSSLPEMAKSHLFYMNSWFEFLKGEFQNAAHFIQKAIAILNLHGAPPFQIGLSSLGAAQIYFETGSVDEAQQTLNTALEIGNMMGSNVMLFHGYSLQAFFSFEKEMESEGMDALENGMAIGKKAGLVNYPWWRSRIMAKLCTKALEHEIEPEYVRLLVQKRNLFPEIPPRHQQDWPWPIKVFTLGNFRLFRFDEEVVFQKKAQKKPLELLKALIAFGGRDVPVAKLIDTLWPDADGDNAYQSFTMALKRLRTLLGKEEALSLAGGRLTLDSRHCWTDAWGFEHFLSDSQEDPVNLKKAIDLYKGQFLEAEDHGGWVVPIRVRLNRKFVSAAVRYGKHYENKGDFQSASDVYETAIEIDDTSEELYQQLMQCYHHMGMPAQVVAVYRRCKEIIQYRFDTEPSECTKRLFQALVSSVHGPFVVRP